MSKILKTTGWIALYLLLYMGLMLVCQLAITLTIGGFGGELMGLLGSAAALDTAGIERAVNTITESMVQYLEKNTGPILAISALVSLLCFSMIFKARKLELPAAARINKCPDGLDVMYGLFAGASANFVVAALIQLFSLTVIFEDAFREYDSHVSFTLGSGGILPALIGVGLVAPIVEEIMFRGIITYELNGVMPVRAAIIVQGLIFGAYHLVPFQIGYTIPLGIYFGFLAYKTGSVWISSAAHVAMNSIAVLMTIPGFANTIETMPEAALLFAGGSIFMFITSLIYFVKRQRDE